MISHRQSMSGSLGITLIISGVLLVIAFSFLIFFLPRILQPDVSLRLGDGVFNAKLALNDSDRTKGLSGVSELDPNQALLMAFPTEGKWGIWMKDMTFPIDIVWLNVNKKVIYIVKNVSPDEGTSITRYPKDPAKYVIELAAGTVDSKSITVNKIAVFQLSPEDIK